MTRTALEIARDGIRFADEFSSLGFAWGIIGWFRDAGLIDQDQHDVRWAAIDVRAAIRDLPGFELPEPPAQAGPGRSGWPGLDDLIEPMAHAAVRRLRDFGYLTPEEAGR